MPVDITLYQGLAKGSKMDLIIQKYGNRSKGILSSGKSIDQL